jgi:nucleoside-diphosphate-sugar epimerase
VKTVLVTGATGFVGRHLIPLLVERGLRLRCLSRGSPPPAIPSVEWVGDVAIERETEWKHLIDGMDGVVHLAALAHQVGVSDARLAPEFDRVNHLATRRLAEAIALAGSPRRLLFLSSIGAVCTSSDVPVNGDTAPHPESAYGRTKLAAERAIETVLRGSPADWCVIRAPLVYGPGNPGNMARLMRLTRLPVLPTGGLSGRRSFVYVGNLVDLLHRALLSPAASRRVLLAADVEQVSTRELIRLLADAAGRGVRQVTIPMPILRLAARAGDVVRLLAGRSIGLDSYSLDRLAASLPIDASETRERLMWRPPFSLEQGIRLTFAGPTGRPT